jgi:hypothetical protein
MNAPFRPSGVSLRLADLNDPAEVRRLERFV